MTILTYSITTAISLFACGAVATILIYQHHNYWWACLIATATLFVVDFVLLLLAKIFIYPGE